MFRNNPWQKQTPSVETKKNWIDDYAPADQAEADYFYDRPVMTAEPARTNAPTKSSPKIRYILAAVVVLLAACASYWLGLQQGRGNTTSVKPTSNTAAAQPAKETGSTMRRFHSSAFGVSFSHPASWHVLEQETKLRILSPAALLTTVNGASANAVISLELTHDGATLSEGLVGRTITRDSEKIIYKSPSPDQRAETYLSFFGGSDGGTEGIGVAYLTGSKGFAAQETIPPEVNLLADPAVTVRIYACENADCTTAKKPLTISPVSWQASGYVNELKALIASFMFD